MARAVGASASSVQDLVNGLVATGLLLEQHRRFRLRPAPHVLHLIAGRVVPRISLADPEVSALAIPVTEGPVVTGALALIHERRGRSERLFLDRAAARLLVHIQEGRT
ncbi:hypothetical protein [Streptomyces roseoverticillatus]|uniref:hypothetical protein n=1 Tax=Streptomyces roseoverticillatus TaxID=66429 RepID=UPI001F169284|nr:hypothetical protein [Streptomyces roseoverticillatus]